MTYEAELSENAQRTNTAVSRWVAEVAAHTNPLRVHVCTGTERDRDAVLAAMADESLGSALCDEREPEEYVSSTRRLDAGPTNRWISRPAAEDRFWFDLRGRMRGRTMFVVPYLLGPPGALLGRAGVQITDSPHAALAMSEVTRVGEAALEALNPRSFVKLVHTRTLRAGERPTIVHFPETQEAWSLGTDSVRGAVLAPTAHALRIASYQAVNEGWLVAKAAVLTITPPIGPVRHVAATFLNPGDAEAFALSLANRDGWRVQVALTGALFLHVGQDGRLWAIAPERVDPFQPHGLPPGAINDYRGIPISAFLYFVRRSDTMPLVLEARSWRHGTSLAASLATERTAGLQQNPLGLLDNTGVNMGDYLDHWLAYGRTLHEPPRVFCVNLHRTGSDGLPLWPGGAENVRLLGWMHGRIEGRRDAVATSVGLVPDQSSPAFSGLEVGRDRFDQLTAIDASAWVAEAERASSFLSRLGSRLPVALSGEVGAQQKKLVSSIH